VIDDKEYYYAFNGGILFYLFNALAIYAVFGFIMSRFGIYFINLPQ